MLYATLWSLITAINRAEKDSCTLQIAREWINGTTEHDFIFGNAKDNPLMGFSQRAMTENSVPIIAVDLSAKSADSDITNWILLFDSYLSFRYVVDSAYRSHLGQLGAAVYTYTVTLTR